MPSRSTALMFAQRHNCQSSSSALMRSTSDCSLGLWRAGIENVVDGAAMSALAAVTSCDGSVPGSVVSFMRYPHYLSGFCPYLLLMRPSVGVKLIPGRKSTG